MLRLQGKVVKCFPDSVTAASCPVPAASMRRLFTCGREGGNHEDIHNGTAPRNLNGFCPDRPPRNGKRFAVSLLTAPVFFVFLWSTGPEVVGFGWTNLYNPSRAEDTALPFSYAWNWPLPEPRVGIVSTPDSSGSFLLYQNGAEWYGK